MKTIITLNEALEKIKQLKNTYYFRRESEKVSLPDSVGREISEDIIADSMSPASDIAAMDGFAVRHEDVVLPEKGFEYILFMNVEGYVITDRNIGKGELVNVYLFC